MRGLMSFSVAPRSESVIVSRLRAAGCVFAEDEARLLIAAATTRASLEALVERRGGGDPTEPRAVAGGGVCLRRGRGSAAHRGSDDPGVARSHGGAAGRGHTSRARRGVGRVPW